MKRSPALRLLLPFALVSAMAVTGASPAHAVTPGPAEPLDSESGLVAGGPGNQTDPHLSGSLLTYTARTSSDSSIRYVDLADGSGGTVESDGARDSLSDVAGDLVVFRRVFDDGTRADRPIMVFDVSAPEFGVRELAPESGAWRVSPSIGATTVAFQQQAGPSSGQTDVCVAEVADLTAPAVCLTSDGATASNRDPSVSSDGSTVAWGKCSIVGTGCDIWVARRDGSAWGSPRQLTDSTGEEIHPDTDGSIVTYASNAGGDWDVWWEDVDGTDEHQLLMTDAPGSTETRPRLSNGAIGFERELPGSTEADLYLYRPVEHVLNRVTEIDGDEILMTLSVSPSGEVRVAWAQPDGLQLGDSDVHALRAQLNPEPQHDTCLLYDPAKSHRAGSVVPLKVRLCDAAGENVSSPEVQLTASGLVKLDGSATTAVADSPGNANPDSAFRYDPDLDGYVFNLSTKGLTRGTWALRFTAAGTTTVHELSFDVR